MLSLTTIRVKPRGAANPSAADADTASAKGRRRGGEPASAQARPVGAPPRVFPPPAAGLGLSGFHRGLEADGRPPGAVVRAAADRGQSRALAVGDRTRAEQRTRPACAPLARTGRPQLDRPPRV